VRSTWRWTGGAPATRIERRRAGLRAKRGALPRLPFGEASAVVGNYRDAAAWWCGGGDSSSCGAPMAAVILELGFGAKGGGAGRRGVPRGRCGAYIGAGAGPRRADHARRGEARAGAADGLEPESGSRWGTRLMGGPHASATEGGGGRELGRGGELGRQWDFWAAGKE